MGTHFVAEIFLGFMLGVGGIWNRGSKYKMLFYRVCTLFPYGLLFLLKF